MRALKKLFVLLVILPISISYLFAQSDEGIYDTKGNDFWLAFLPNYHNNYSVNPSLAGNDSIYLFITSEFSTMGKIEYTDRFGNDYSTTFTIINPNDFFTFKISHFDFELGSYNRSGDILSDNDFLNQCEMVAPNTFHITSDNEISVVAHNQAVTSADAFLVYPTDILGTEYLVLSYNTDGSVPVIGLPPYTPNGSSTPSQFVIVVTEDSSKITINPSTETYRHSKAPFEVVLNKGQCYLVQARITENNPKSDLTGTFIQSDKPIGVFSGHQRAKVPVANNNLETRDFLAEQLLPVNTWGKNAFVFPLITPPDAANEGSDLYRILSGSYNNNVFINGKLEGCFNRGEFIEKSIAGTATIESNGPILVAQYKKSSQEAGDPYHRQSDPFMLILSPKEQFQATYNVVNLQTYEYNGWSTSKVYSLHYITILASKNAIENCLIDDSLVDINLFQPIQPDSEYYYANIPVSEGKHTINSTENIAVYVYGYGSANSYAYNGGAKITTVGIKDSRVSDDYLYNVNPNPVIKLTKFNFHNPEDSKVMLKLYDLLGNECLKLLDEFRLKGYHQIEADLSYLENGIYFSVLATNTSTLTKKLIKIEE